MNASDIVKSKQDGALYKAYYQPTVFISTVTSTITPFSSIGGTPSYTSCINTVYNYQCNAPFISYELANDVNDGKYICGGKTVSKMTWKANTSVPTETIYAFSTYSTSQSNASTILSVNSYGVRPLICPDPIFYQGTNFANQCEVCNNFGAGINACCHNCASGT